MRSPRLVIAVGICAFLVMAGVVFVSAFRTKNGQLPQELEQPANPSSPGSGASVRQISEQTETESSVRFLSMSNQSGIDMIYYGSPSAETFMTEQNGGGVALADFDYDGRLDVFLVNGSHFHRPADNRTDSSRLYRAGSVAFHFDDVTEHTGLEAVGFGMGCAAADYNNDGFTDIFVAYYGRNQLWRNNGDGTFEVVTQESLLEGDAWSTSAAFADFDADGDLDLYVVNYVEWSANDPPCYFPHLTPVQISCSPMSREGQADQLFRNRGDGTFEEIGESAGIAIPVHGKGLGVSVADFNGDGSLDIYVANDTTPNFLFRNQGEMTFRDVAVIEGVALSEDGSPGAGMGIATGDYNHDGTLDIFVTNFKDQVHDAFANLGSNGFVATNSQLGLDSLTRSKLSFGIVLADFDLDHSLDLFVANGHIWELTSVDPSFAYAMSPSVYHNDSGERFRDVSQSSGEYFSSNWVGRSVAAGDLDNDGDTDLVVTHLQEPPAILNNTSIRRGDSATLRLIGTNAARQPLGIQVDVSTGERSVVTQIPSGGSFQASHDQRIVVAVGAADVLSEVTVHWSPDDIETWKALPVDGEIILVQGMTSQSFRLAPKAGL